MAGEAAKTVTISAEEYGTLTGIRTLMDKAWRDKGVGAAFRKQLKAVQPDLNIPDEMADSVLAPVTTELEAMKAQNAALLKRLDDRDAAETETKAVTSMQSQLADVRKKYNFDDEGMNKVIERMRAKGNPDAEAAGAFIFETLPKPKPVTDAGFAPSYADTQSVFGAADGGDDDMKLLHSGDPMRFFDKKVAEIMNETRDAA